MEKLKYLAAVTLLLAGCAVSYYAGRISEHSCHEKDYEAACHMSDLIRCYEDHLKEDSIIEDWGCFEELESTFLYEDALGTPVNLREYVWCY